MANLTPEQITLLKWMRAGRTFEVCSDYCPHNGDVQPKSLLPIQVHHKTIHKLIKEGLIHYTPQQFNSSTVCVGMSFPSLKKGRAFDEYTRPFLH
ncbi:hypothetical protein ACRTC9_21390 [Vibrio vulnificus]|uniref:hypothetical protein n=1 Tax=Vibrio vulnificus TaxID=672 RepID=UPI003D7C7AE5